MVRASNQHIVDALRLAREMLTLAEQGEIDAMDDGCRVLFGEVRDCAYRIRARAEREREAHRGKYIWDFRDEPELADEKREAKRRPRTTEQDAEG